jgi:hypothetical protein
MLGSQHHKNIEKEYYYEQEIVFIENQTQKLIYEEKLNNLNYICDLKINNTIKSMNLTNLYYTNDFVYDYYNIRFLLCSKYNSSEIYC